MPYHLFLRLARFIFLDRPKPRRHNGGIKLRHRWQSSEPYSRDGTSGAAPEEGSTTEETAAETPFVGVGSGAEKIDEEGEVGVRSGDFLPRSV